VEFVGVAILYVKIVIRWCHQLLSTFCFFSFFNKYTEYC